MNKTDKNKKSVGSNMLLNAIRTTIVILSPLITAPYISRVLSVEDIGKYSFSSALLSYFTIVSSQAVGLYAIREGAPLRDRSDRIIQFSNQLYSLSVDITIVEYAVLLALLAFVPNLSAYKNLILIMCLSIAFTTFGLDWLYSIYEDYLFVTIRTIVIRLITIILTFFLIRTPEDLYKYGLLYTITAMITGLLNRLNSRKYIPVRYTLKKCARERLSHIFYITLSTAAIVIYTSFDTLMLGFMTDDYYTGLYGMASKIYTLLKSFLSAFIVVSIPRFSYYLGNGKKDKFNNLLNILLRGIITAVIPISVGCISLSKEILIVLFGNKYSDASLSLAMLSVAAAIAMFAYVFTQCVMMPLKMEKTLTYITLISALANIVLNFILIPNLKQNGAALTTIVAETITLMMAYILTRKHVDIDKMTALLLKVGAGVLVEIIVCEIAKSKFHNNLCVLFFGITLSVVFYFVIEYFLKNFEVIRLVEVTRHKFQRRRSKL